MIDLDRVREAISIADQVEERYRVPLFTFLIAQIAQPASVGPERSAIATAGNHVAEPPEADIARILREAPRSDLKLLAAIRLGEMSEGGSIPTNLLAGIYRRYRVKPPGNIPRDVANLIRKGLVLESERGSNRIAHITLTHEAMNVLGENIG